MDELGIGFLLVSIYKLINLNTNLINKNLINTLINDIIETSLTNLDRLIKSYNNDIPNSLVFRKCGVSIGLGLLKKLTSVTIPNEIKVINLQSYRLERFDKYYQYIDLYHKSFEKSFNNSDWNNHRDINTVMYLVSKNPDFMV